MCANLPKRGGKGRGSGEWKQSWLWPSYQTSFSQPRSIETWIYCHTVESLREGKRCTVSRGFITVNMQDSVGVSFLRQITVNCREVSEGPGLRKELKRLVFFLCQGKRLQSSWWFSFVTLHQIWSPNGRKDQQLCSVLFLMFHMVVTGSAANEHGSCPLFHKYILTFSGENIKALRLFWVHNI